MTNEHQTTDSGSNGNRPGDSRLRSAIAKLHARVSQIGTGGSPGSAAAIDPSILRVAIVAGMLAAILFFMPAMAVGGELSSDSANGDVNGGAAADLIDDETAESLDLKLETAAATEGTVYVGSDDGTLYAIDAATGNQEWAFNPPEGGAGSSPTVTNGTVYTGVDGAVYAIDASTGAQEWNFTDPSNSVSSSPTVVDGTVYVGSNDYNLYAIDAATGAKEWSFNDNFQVKSSPTVVDGTVYVGTEKDTLYALDASTGNEEWAFTEPSGGVGSSPTVVDGTVYVGASDSTLYAIDAATGAQEWAFTEPSDQVDSSPTVADGTVYVGSNDNTLYAVDAATGAQEWAFTNPSDKVESSPTVADGTVYVGSEDQTLYAVDAATGNQEWAFTDPTWIESSPTFVSDGSDQSDGSRVMQETLGHHGDTGPDPVTGEVLDQAGNELENANIELWTDDADLEDHEQSRLDTDTTGGDGYAVAPETEDVQDVRVDVSYTTPHGTLVQATEYATYDPDTDNVVDVSLGYYQSWGQSIEIEDQTGEYSENARLEVRTDSGVVRSGTLDGWDTTVTVEDGETYDVWVTESGMADYAVSSWDAHYDSATQTVTLTLEDRGVDDPDSGYGDNDTTSTPAPLAAIDYSPSGPTTADTVTFDASGSTVYTSGASYSWELPNGTTRTGSTADWSASERGSYDVTLTVEDDGGDTDSVTRSIWVGSDSSDVVEAPTADFFASPGSPSAGELVTLNASASQAKNGTEIIAHDWYVDGEHVGEGENHEISLDSGSHTVELEVTAEVNSTITSTESLSIFVSDDSGSGSGGIGFAPPAPGSGATPETPFGLLALIAGGTVLLAGIWVLDQRTERNVPTAGFVALAAVLGVVVLESISPGAITVPLAQGLSQVSPLLWIALIGGGALVIRQYLQTREQEARTEWLRS